MRRVVLSILGFSLAKICNLRILGTDGVSLVVWTACYLAPACASKRVRIREGATEQIVGREPNQRACHRQLVRRVVDSSRVNSTGMRL